jgi:hypothetical protein
MTTSIFDVDDSGYIYEDKLRARAIEMRAELVGAAYLGLEGPVRPLEARPTLRLRPEDDRTIIWHIHEGAWTIGMHEEDLPGFVPEEIGR